LKKKDRYWAIIEYAICFSALPGLLLGLLLHAATAWGQQVQPNPAAKKKIVILFSYRQGWWAVKDEDRGILQGLSALGYTEGAGLDITRLYMNTKTVNKTAEQMEVAAAVLLRQIEALAPDVLLIMDDDALRHVGAKLLDTALPIVFGGINLIVTDSDYGWVTSERRSALADSMARPGHNITGVLERIAIPAGFNLLHQILPDAKTALFLSDKSVLSRQMLRTAGDKAALNDLPIKIVRQLFTDSYELMQQTVLDYQDRVDCIVMFLPWTFEDNQGRHVPQDQVMHWLLENNKRPGIAYLDILAEEGFLCGVVVDMAQQGVNAGIIAGRILSGERPADIQIADPVANRIMINLARARQLNIDIPFEILKNADVLLKTMTAYPEFKTTE
jgi:putative ABC transport system substrate-binding protein